jgi:hypothetical protein
MRLLLVSSILGLMLFSLFSCAMVGGAENSLMDVVHVKSETELRAAVDNAKTGTQIVIALDNDIILTEDTLLIKDEQNITLISNKINGFYQLIGATKDDPFFVRTISVARGGVLRLDGIIVTHVRGVYGSGVTVNRGGTLILLSGKISDNHVPNIYADAGLGHYIYVCEGGGVENHGVFKMFGGEITNNTAGIAGGGIYNKGTFTMHDGTISGNKAELCGGGVYNGGTFGMFGGEITDNTAGESGSDVSGVVDRFGGTISGNSVPEGSNTYPEKFETYGVICVGVMVMFVGFLFLYFKFLKKGVHVRGRIGGV